MAKVFISDATDGTVGYRCLDGTGAEVVREFWVAPSGGAVRELAPDRPGALAPQACALLSNRGPTLQSSREGLLEVIRAEVRRTKRIERRIARS